MLISSFLLVALSCWKRTQFTISIKFDLNNWKSYFQSVTSPSFDKLYCSQLVYMNRMETMIQDLPFFAPRRPKKITINFLSFVTRVELTSWFLLRPWFKGFWSTPWGKLLIKCHGGPTSSSKTMTHFLKRFIFIFGETSKFSNSFGHCHCCHYCH